MTEIIESLTAERVAWIVREHVKTGWNKPEGYFEACWETQKWGETLFLVSQDHEQLAIIGERSPFAGTAVGLYGTYGAAQPLYVLRGHLADGRGVTHRNEAVEPVREVRLDDDLVLHMTKRSGKRGSH